MSGKAYFVISGELYLEKLRADFKDMDFDGDGTVTRTDLRQKAKELNYILVPNIASAKCSHSFFVPRVDLPSIISGIFFSMQKLNLTHGHDRSIYILRNA